MLARGVAAAVASVVAASSAVATSAVAVASAVAASLAAATSWVAVAS